MYNVNIVHISDIIVIKIHIAMLFIAMLIDIKNL